MTRHAQSTNNHRLESWVFPNASARTASTGYTIDDVGRVAFQQDSTSYWRVSSVNSNGTGVWAAVNALDGEPASQAAVDAVQDDLDNHKQLVSSQNTAGHLSFEQIQDMLSTFFSFGAGLETSYNDASNTLTVSATATEITSEQVYDIIAPMFVGSSDILVVADDATNTITIQYTGTSGGGGGGSSGDGASNPMTAGGDMIVGAYESPILSNVYTNYTLASPQPTVSGSSSVLDAAYLLDEYIITYAQFSDAVYPLWAKLTFNAAKTVRSFRIAQTPGGGRLEYDLQSSTDNTNWTTRYSMREHTDDTGRMLLPTNVTARYWRVMVANPHSGETPSWELALFELYGPAGAEITNVATEANGVEITGSPSVGGSYDQSKLIDSPTSEYNTNSYYRSGIAKAAGVEIIFDLQEARRIVAYRLMERNRTDMEIGYYKVQSSVDGTTWVDRFHNTSDSPESGVHHFTSSITARYWRFVSDTRTTPPNDPWEIYTIKLFEENGANAGDQRRLPIGSVGQHLVVIDNAGSSTPAWQTPTPPPTIPLRKQSAQWHFTNGVLETTDGAGAPIIIDQTGSVVTAVRLYSPTAVSGPVVVSVQYREGHTGTWYTESTTNAQINTGDTFGGSNAVFTGAVLQYDDILRINIVDAPSDLQTLTVRLTLEADVS